LFKVDPFKRYRDKVAIVGFTSHSVKALELGDDFEIWGLNELYRYMPPDRFHRWFEIHGREYLSQDKEGQKHIEDIKTVLGPIPIYMQRKHDDIPGSVRFPIEDLCRDLGSEYWTNCPAEMIGFAIRLGYKEIHIYGVDMAQESEYATQRPCCEYWLGIAIGRGIKVYVPPESDLMKSVGIYGYEGNSPLGLKMGERWKWLQNCDNERLGQIRGMESQYANQRGELTRRIHTGQGALEELDKLDEGDYRTDRVTAIEAEITSTRKDLTGLETEYNKKHMALMTDRNHIVGSINELEYWQRTWVTKTSSPDGGNIPTAEQRAGDPRTGIEAPSGDSVPTVPSGFAVAQK
jgi:hypothetical protein